MAQWSKDVFAKNLRKYMNRAGRTQREVAEVCGVSTATFSDWINAKKYPRIDKIEILADYFGIMKSDLIEEKMSEEKEKDNEAIASIIVRMRLDKDFMSVVETLYQMDSSKVNAVKEILNAFQK